MRLLVLWVCAWPLFGGSCESLSSLKIPGAAITLAEQVAAGAFPGAAFKDLAAFCRVTATLKPSDDSEVKIEVWLPAAGWNHKFEGNGNGGWTGSINPSSLAASLRRGYATAMTDTGHEGGSASFALDHPEKLIDFAYRAVHDMTVAAKSIIQAYYGEPARLSYWNGCSQGGRQGLTEAQLFPGEYDGIVAGAPANNWTHMMAQMIWVAQSMHNNQAAYIPPEKYAAIHKAVIAACDAHDGVRDGVLEDPTKCKFDPKPLECRGSDSSDCLTPPQMDALRRIYGDVTNPRTHEYIFPGLEPGSELGWAAMAGPQANVLAADEFKYVVFKNPDWDYHTLNFDTDIQRADEEDHGLLNSTDPNLKTFVEKGGKLLVYHGWNDQLISPRNSIDYLKSVQKMAGPKVSDSYRLFMVPGMKHCAGGDGATSFDMLHVIEDWVENGKAPDRIVASRSVDGKVVQTHPLCAYPQVAVYKGKGSTDDAQNFTCKVR